MECNAVRELKEEGRAEGLEEGIAKGGNLMLYKLVQSGDIPLARGAVLAKMTEEEFRRNAEECDIHLEA